MRNLGARVFGLSSQPLEEQLDFARREHLPYPLLSDPDFRLADSLRLPTFEVEGTAYYRRLTFVAETVMQLACGPGEDYPAGRDPDHEKRRLEIEHCDQADCEPLIAALANARRRPGRSQ